MKVSVILISYNQEKYIAKAIDSIISQKVDCDIELVVADDSSSDETLSIIKSRENSSGIEFKYLPMTGNLGMKMNYFRAFLACTGDYVAILEGDDWWSADSHLQQHVEFLTNHPECSMSFNRITVYQEGTGLNTLGRWPFQSDYRSFSFKDQVLMGNVIGNLSACVFRTKLINKLPLNFFKLNFADWELGMFMGQFGKIAELKESTSIYRVNNSGQWTGLSEEDKKTSVVNSLMTMDDFFEGRYHRVFVEAADNVKNGIDYVPTLSYCRSLKKIMRRFLRHISNR